jgi:hypothetical protein
MEMEEYYKNLSEKTVVTGCGLGSSGSGCGPVTELHDHADKPVP